ncbi:hypothetical protein [uncultured Desulfuromonas sp.]|uniref:hypothetical protein n=1 Tax=uncultured Desulfuromonas sp. TaxID=181013 RepID=UPI002AABF1A0|nr:hypothetical protein [uncultured Desulfuromonas sp.]
MKKLLGVEIFGGLAFAIGFVSLSYVALSEKAITTGDPRTGIIHTATGNNAVMLGFAFLALGLASLAYLVRYSRYQFIYWILLAALWLGITLWYWQAYL